MSFRYRHGERPLEGYTIQRGVGRGAFGEVYYAVSDGGREVALKTILHNQDIELRGIQHCINLKSPHLVSIFDVRKTDDGTPVVIMEYVAGPSLRDLLHEFPSGLGPQRSAYLLREIAKGLAYLHERAIVHRDLKPENLFYEDGYVKIGDYGLSKYVSVSRQSGQTMSVGTVHYMAPEIGSGVYNQSIDIYALGIILHELLTGEVPFTGASFGEILMKHLTAEPDLRRLEEPFRAVIARALRKKPQERYANVEDMARELFTDAALTKSVHVFNPTSLSVAARRFAVQGSQGAATAGSETRAVAAPAVAAPPPDSGRPPPGTLRAGTVPSGWPPAPEPREVPEAAVREATASAPSAPRAAAPPALQAADALDPLDRSQRLARAALILFGATAAVSAVGLVSNHLAGMFGFALVTVSSTAAILAVETVLGPRHRIAPGLPRRVAIGALALFPAGIGAVLVHDGRGAMGSALAVLLTIAIADWSKRSDPRREERFSGGRAFTAGLLAFVLGLVLADDHENAFAGALALATVSLAVNAYAPFVPHELRRKKPPRAAPTAAPDTSGAPAASPLSTSSENGFGAAAARADGDAWARAGRPPLALPVELGPVAPSHAARIFWLFVGALFAAAGLSCLAIPLVVEVRPPAERLAYGGVFIGAMGYLAFCLYRALWVRRRGLWGRTLRPFAIATLGNFVAICAYLFSTAPSAGAWPASSDDSITALCLGLGGLVLLLFLLGFDRLVNLDADAAAQGARLPRAWRPVHPVVRLAELLLAAGACAVGLGLAVVGAFGRVDAYDRAAMLSSSFALGAFAAWFAYHALRYRRGHLWESTLRPFLLTVSTGAVGVFSLFLLLRPERTALYDDHPSDGRGPAVRVLPSGYDQDETIACVVVTVIAAVFGVFAFFVRGPGRELARSRLLWWRAPPGEPRRPAARGSAWRGLGTLCWFAALAAVLAAVALRCGVGDVLARAGGVDPASVPGHPKPIAHGTPALGLAIAGSLFILIGRRHSGAAHVLRALAGQLALVAAGAVLLAFGAGLRVEELGGSLVVHAGGEVGKLTFFFYSFFALGLAGTLLLLWPGRRNAAADDEHALTPRPEVD
jgi:hypothetical protein